MGDHATLDGWIAQLMECQPLSETEVKQLCDKVDVARIRCKFIYLQLGS